MDRVSQKNDIRNSETDLTLLSLPSLHIHSTVPFGVVYRTQHVSGACFIRAGTSPSMHILWCCVVLREF